MLRRYINRWQVVAPQHLTLLDSPAAVGDFRAFIPSLLAELQALAVGRSPGQIAPEEDQVVELIEDRLSVIVGLTLPAIQVAFDSDDTLRRALKEWMLQDQGWQWDDALANELLMRATQWLRPIPDAEPPGSEARPDAAGTVRG